MSKYLHIYNDGLIDVKAFELIGASTKRNDDSKIGFFGSGLKYSIAALLRNQIEFKVYSGGQEYKFTTNRSEFRNEVFDVISINDKPTSFTTQMGPDWEPWFIVREIYCNALDETNGGCVITDELPEIDPFKTQFIITVNSAIEDVVKNWNNYFSDSRNDLLYYNNLGKIYEASIDHTLVYRKGIRAYYAERTENSYYKSLFHYDFEHLSINESRVAKNEYQMQNLIGRILGSCSAESVIRKLVNSFKYNDSYELHCVDQFDNFSETWLTVIDERILVPREFAGFYQEEIEQKPDAYLLMPSTLIRSLSNYFGKKIKSITEEDDNSSSSRGAFKKIEPNNKMQFLLKECVKSLEEMEYAVNYPIEIGRFTNESTLARANQRHKKIQLSEKLFDLGKRQIAAAIIEECEHLNTNFNDCTRQFQNHWINLYISEKEQRFGLFL
jgi:hypothetical protein